MFSSKHKDTAFFSPLNQFSDVCKRALKAVPGLNKAFKNFLTDTLLMFALLPRKVNFTQLEIYGKYCEKTYWSGFSKTFEWVDFNLELSSRLFKEGDRKAIAIDPSYISKSGNPGTSWPTHTSRCPNSQTALRKTDSILSAVSAAMRP